MHNIRNLCIAYENMGDSGIKVEYGSRDWGQETILNRDLIIDAKQKCLFLNNVRRDIVPDQEVLDVIFKSFVQI
eukprot:403372388